MSLENIKKNLENWTNIGKGAAVYSPSSNKMMIMNNSHSLEHPAVLDKIPISPIKHMRSIRGRARAGYFIIPVEIL